MHVASFIQLKCATAYASFAIYEDCCQTTLSVRNFQLLWVYTVYLQVFFSVHFFVFEAMTNENGSVSMQFIYSEQALASNTANCSTVPPPPPVF